jgi:hypothetical protein
MLTKIKREIRQRRRDDKEIKDRKNEIALYALCAHRDEIVKNEDLDSPIVLAKLNELEEMINDTSWKLRV